jgi:hypothetical protein
MANLILAKNDNGDVTAAKVSTDDQSDIARALNNTLSLNAVSYANCGAIDGSDTTGIIGDNPVSFQAIQ